MKGFFFLGNKKNFTFFVFKLEEMLLGTTTKLEVRRETRFAVQKRPVLVSFFKLFFFWLKSKNLEDLIDEKGWVKRGGISRAKNG